jgi:hypothetical protein
MDIKLKYVELGACWLRGCGCWSLVVFCILLSVGCGGGFPPEALRSATVEVHEVSVQKKLIYKNPSIGLVQGIFQVAGADKIAVVGRGKSCLFTSPGTTIVCAKTPAQLGVVPPVSLHGSFLSDGYMQVDFDGNGEFERIRPLGETGFKLEKIDGVEIAQIQLDQDYWFKPTVTWSQPHYLLVSTDGALLVFDNHLKEIRNLQTPGIKAPLHISDGTPLDIAGKGPFVSVYRGRGGWHRTILFIHSSDGRVIYKEIVVGDFKVVCPLSRKDGEYRFLLGGRGEVFEYSFLDGPEKRPMP